MPKRKRQDPPEPEGDSPQPERPAFFNTTFTPYRISPLHIGAEPLNEKRLQTFSKRLRDTLVGDVVRGVQVGLTDDATLGTAGALERVDIRWFRTDDLLGRDNERQGSEELGTGEGEETGEASRMLVIELHYENTTFTGLLLPDISANLERSARQDASGQWTSHPSAQPLSIPVDSSKDSAFTHLPLLLLKGPAPLKSVINDFLCRTFDCRISVLRLGTQTLVANWETWLSASGLVSRHGLTKDVAILLGFYVESTKENPREPPTKSEKTQLGLKGIDVIIPAEEVTRFLRAGEIMVSDRGRRKSDAAPLSASRRRRLAGGKAEEGWAWREQETSREAQPFMDALAAYMDQHLALDLFHPGVRIQRIACDGFMLSETRVKIFAPPAVGDDDAVSVGNRAVRKFVAGLVEKARGAQLRSWDLGV